MSITGSYAGKSSPAIERRLHVRQQLNELVYVNIGADNGGIVLNVTDVGIAFQAAVPLNKETHVSLHIQLPRSRTLIQTMAKIVWLSPENRQAGVLFLDTPAEARLQVQAWIRDLLSPSQPAGESARRKELWDNSLGKQAKAPTRKDKWLKLMAESHDQQLHVQNTPSIEANVETIHPESIVPDDPVALIEQRHAIPDGAPQDVHLRDQLSDETPIYRPPDQPESALYHLQLDVHSKDEGSAESKGDTTPQDKLSNNDLIDWPIRAVQIVAPQDHADLRRGAISHRKSNGSSEHNGTPSATPSATKTSPVPDLLMPAANRHARTWRGIVILFVGIALLCFGIGIWIGRRGGEAPEARISPDTSVIIPVAKSVSGTDDKANGNGRQKAKRQETSVGDEAPRNVTKSHLPTIAPAANSPSLESASQAASAKQGPPPPTGVKPPEITPSPVPIVAEAADLPPTIIIGGRRFRPSDRFNSSHVSYRVEPVYPLTAKQQQIQGTVKIRQVIGTDGRVLSVKLLSGPALLAPAALEAAKYWRYFPALLNGQPVETEMDIEIDFRLPR